MSLQGFLCIIFLFQVVQAQNPLGYPCQYDYHCQFGYICQRGICSCPPAVPTNNQGAAGASCVYDYQCQLGLSCQRNICAVVPGAVLYSAGTTCTYDHQCKLGLKCVRNVCTLATAANAAVTCPDGRVAISSCDSVGSCPQTQYCYNKGCCPIPNCADGSPALSPCSTSSPCPTSYSCVNGSCCAQKSGVPGNVCPSGQPLLDRNNGQLISCIGASTTCPDTALCNPLSGFCCTSLRVCTGQGSKPELGTNNKPKVCTSGCGTNYQCQRDTGFCCQATLPKIGEVCSVGGQCASLTAVCNLQSDGKYRCECLAALGYVASGGDCVRSRKLLEESCQSDAECRAAFSECKKDTRKCACRSGFTKDTINGGCTPTAYKCGDGKAPLQQSGKIVQCERYSDTSSAQTTRPANVSMYYDCPERRDAMKDTCPENNYCVSFYDQPGAPNRYKGFCCPKPSMQAPQCPVGSAHESSKAPYFGCDGCTMSSHFCHEDPRVTSLKICCPKPCPNPEDIYANSQCYPPATYNDFCDVDAQCIGITVGTRPTSIPGLISGMKCLAVGTTTIKRCNCERGFVLLNGQCMRAQCTVGLRAEPLTGSDGVTSRCTPILQPMPIPLPLGPNGQSVATTCPTGSECDPMYGVCCKSFKGFFPTCPFNYPADVTKGQCGSHFDCNPQASSYCLPSEGDQTVKLCCIIGL